MGENKENKEWCVWIEPSTKTMSLTELSNAVKKNFGSEKEMVDFCAKFMMKGFRLG